MSKNLRTLLIVALLLGSALVALRLLFPPASFVPTEIALEYSRRQVLGQLQPGWNLRSVGRNTERVRTILHRVEVSDEIAGELLLMSRGERQDRVGEVACPAADDPIWEQLTRGQDVLVELSTAKGPFDKISCRAAIL